jgi:hypothetical protein
MDKDSITPVHNVRLQMCLVELWLLKKAIVSCCGLWKSYCRSWTMKKLKVVWLNSCGLWKSCCQLSHLRANPTCQPSSLSYLRVDPARQPHGLDLLPLATRAWPPGGAGGVAAGLRAALVRQRPAEPREET